MANPNIKQLHWTQRVALVRHNLHAASRSGDFSFFKSVQAAGMIEGTNHFATLTATLGDNADILLAGLDNLNVGLAYVHQDAFGNVYDNLKNAVREETEEGEDRARLFVDIKMQRNVADLGIDKLVNSVVALIEQQPSHIQDEATNVWVTGVTLIADSIEVALQQMESLDLKRDDFIRVEDSWNTVKASVVAAVTSLKGVFSLMNPAEQQDDKEPRSMSISSAGSAVFRRLSTAFQSPPNSRSSSIVSTSAMAVPRGPQVSFGMPVYRTPTSVRSSLSSTCPTRLPSKLAPIPPTPHTEDVDPLAVHVTSVPTNVVESVPTEDTRMSQEVM